MSPCSLCSLSGIDPELIVARTAAAAAVLHDDWAVRGHAMIVATEHVENVADLSASAAESFFELLRRTELALLNVLRTDRVLVLKLGLAVPHLHYHLYPVSRDFSRADFFSALNLETRDEPEEADRLTLLHRLRRELGESPDESAAG